MTTPQKTNKSSNKPQITIIQIIIAYLKINYTVTKLPTIYNHFNIFIKLYQLHFKEDNDEQHFNYLMKQQIIKKLLFNVFLFQILHFIFKKQKIIITTSQQDLIRNAKKYFQNPFLLEYSGQTHNTPDKTMFNKDLETNRFLSQMKKIKEFITNVKQTQKKSFLSKKFKTIFQQLQISKEIQNFIISFIGVNFLESSNFQHKMACFFDRLFHWRFISTILKFQREQDLLQSYYFDNVFFYTLGNDTMSTFEKQMMCFKQISNNPSSQKRIFQDKILANLTFQNLRQLSKSSEQFSGLLQSQLMIKHCLSISNKIFLEEQISDQKIKIIQYSPEENNVESQETASEFSDTVSQRNNKN